ncbi:hypothetical protein EXIGLDRAFT_841250 [Exidia glandulosa HHB12029]|uniref:N-acetyltransferase domain-containing protein n=1 Tax=Exidia glandulosa HHB12029 TaxID=1314781 RepID=A0A165ZUQ7_EXIGL|nr:hypothetical protein EXIGLDRAFT_841250 [Exidia glandulosa HHB12029]
MEYRIELVQSPSDDVIERIVDVLHEAFAFKYFIGSLGDSELSKALLKTHVTAALVEDAGEIYVARSGPDADGSDIVAVAVWFGPVCAYLGTDAQREAGWNDLYKQMDQVYKDWWDYFLPFYDEYTTQALGPGVKLSGFHLQVIGVHPSHRRRGIAAALFRAVEKKAEARGVCSCLETVGSFAVPIYRSLGYDVKEPVPLRSAKDPTATAPLYCFIKPFAP